MKTQRFRFKRSERLKNRNSIKNLFENGQSFLIYPFKILWTEQKSDEAIRILISVPKRNVRHAVSRNLLKRRIRESYRLNNGEVKEKLILENKQIDCAIIYLSRKIENYDYLETKMKKVFIKMNEVFN